jgi:hypothetical protein
MPTLWILALAGLIMIIVALIYGRRRFFKTMGVICACLIFGALIAKKPLEHYQEKQKADLEARKQSLKTQQMASYKTEWERYKPIYDTFGMNEVWTSYEAGRCEEGKQILGLNRPTYRQTILNKERQSFQKPLPPVELQKAVDNMLAMADKGYDMCVRIRESMKQDPTPTPVASQSLGEAFKNMKASNSLSELGQIRTSLAIYYGNTKGHYPAKLGDLIGKEGTVFDVSGPTKAKSIQSIPGLVLPDHPETQEVVIYSSDVCGGTNLNKIDSTKLKDTGMWGYVADPKAECYGTAFIDCTHVNRVSGKHWYEY